MARRHYQYEGRTEQLRAGLKRKNDAWKLLSQGKSHARGAMYLAGYAIECRIKAQALEIHRCPTLEKLVEHLGLDTTEIYSHKLEQLLKQLLPQGIYTRFTTSPAWADFAQQVNTWTPQWRYDPEDKTESEAEKFLMAVDNVWKWLGNNS